MPTATGIMKEIEKANSASIEQLRRQVSYLGSQAAELNKNLVTHRKELEDLLAEKAALLKIVAGLAKKVEAAEDEIKEAQTHSENHLRAIEANLTKREAAAVKAEKAAQAKIVELNQVRSKAVGLVEDFQTFLLKIQDSTNKQTSDLIASLPKLD